MIVIDNTIPSAGRCPYCGSDGAPHSPACPAGERYRQVQDINYRRLKATACN